MPDPVLIIPGTQATTLRDQANRVVYNAVTVSLPLVAKSLGGYPKSQWRPLMSMEYAPGELAPRRTSLLAGTTLAAGEVLLSPYALFPKYWAEWPYDWREDIRRNAARLLDDLRARAARGDARASLVGHSQGGVIVVVASKLAAPGEFARLVSRVVLVGAPLAGSLRAVEALVMGNASLGKDTQPIARAIARTWPSIYQMLPAWPCVTDAAGTPLPAGQQLLSMGGWPAGSNEGITEDMLERGRAVQALLASPFDGFGPGISVTTIMGVNQQTGVRLERTGNTFTRIVPQSNAGDTLVPYQATMDRGGNPFRYTVIPFGQGTRPHAELCCDYSVKARIESRINEPAPHLPA
jgi:pimeloyl-ACP methyl ester carboxylesterase